MFFDALACACRIAGYSSVWTTSAQWWSVQGAVAVLWHGQLRTEGEFQQLRHIAVAIADRCQSSPCWAFRDTTTCSVRPPRAPRPCCRFRFYFPICGTHSGR